MNELKFKDSKHKTIALYYGISAVTGFILVTYQLLSNPFHILVLCLYAVIYVQLIYMFIGSLHYWHQKQSGLKILFWTSFSLIPAFYTPLVAYIPKLSSGLFLYYETGFGANGIGFDFFIFANTTLRIFNEQFWRFGLNLIELFIFLRFSGLASAQNISMLPFKTNNQSHPL